MKTRCFSSDEDEFQFGPWLHSITGGCKREFGIPHSEARDENDDDESEDSLHIGRRPKELPMVPVIRNLVHSVVTPRSDTAISAREKICSSITQEDSNVQKE